MSSADSVTHWLALLQAGDRAAVGPLWERYFRRLVGLARQKLRARPNGLADEEDVALSAFDSFCRGAEQGRFPRLEDRDDLWRLLLVIAARKVAHHARDAAREKRGGGKVLAEADLARDEAGGGEALLARVMGNEPAPDFAAEVAEEWRRLLDRLGDDTLRTIAVMRMDGHTVEEIADHLGVSVRTVERKLVVIRDCWGAEGQPS
jgi:DNA-directed RNA polymerase specialized sigma24 family protein